MIQYFKKYAAFSIALAVVTVSLMSTVSAQSGSIGGKPAQPRADNPRTQSIFVETIEPGQSKANAVKVINNTSDTKNVQLYAVDAVNSSGGAFACAQAADQAVGVGSWIKLAENSVTLAGGASQEVVFTISVPDNADVGEHNGCVVMQEQKDSSFKEGIGISFRTAIRVAVLVPGEIKKGLSLDGLNVTRNNNLLILHPSVTNTGNVSVDATIKPAVKTVLGTTIETQNNTFPVLRGQTADWNFEFKKPFWGGLYRTTYSVAYDASNNGVIGAKTEQAATEVSGPSKWVFVVPAFPALVVELLVLAALGAAVAMFMRRRQQQTAVKQTWQSYTVKKGEQLRDIAKKHHISWKELAKANKIKPPYDLRDGQAIRVPKKPTAKKS